MQQTIGSRLWLTALTAALAYAETIPSSASSWRTLLGAVEPLAHTRAQLRLGWLAINDQSDARQEAALGGHIHLSTRRWHALRIALEGYGLLHPRRRPSQACSDLAIVAQRRGFATLSQAFVEGRWHRTTLRLGRQMIETPHADSDDIRMMPNYFRGALFVWQDRGLKVHAGAFDRMAGWENGGDPARFRPIPEILGASSKGFLRFAGILWHPSPKRTLQAWLYHIDGAARILYVAWEGSCSLKNTTFEYGFQYDRARALPEAPPLDSRLYGVRAALHWPQGPSLTAAWNRVLGPTQAAPSLGGGPYYTSMEETTVDALPKGARAWNIGLHHRLAYLGVEADLVHGRFESRGSGTPPSSRIQETDLRLRYLPTRQSALTLRLSRTLPNNAKKQWALRLFVNLNEAID